MRILAPLALALLCLLPLVPPAIATHGTPACPTYDINETVGPLTVHANGAGQVMLDIDEGLFYVTIDHVEVTYREDLIDHLTHPQGGIGAVNWATQALENVGWNTQYWVYQESNGVPGLQRHDDYCTTPGYNSFWTADWIVA